MAFLGKEYKFEKQENFEAFLKSVGVSGEEAARIAQHTPSAKLEKDGDTYIYTTVSPNKTKTIKFKSGEPFDEEIRPGVMVKSVYTVEGNTVTQVVKDASKDDGKQAVFKREYNGDKMVVTITSNFWDGSARRFYTAA